MDDGFTFWRKHLDFKYFSTCLNNLHPSIKYTFEKAKLTQSNHSEPYKVLNFLDIEVILHSNNTFKTVYTILYMLKCIYCKNTNVHDYLHIKVHIQNVVKDNLPYNLAKRIIVFVSNDKKVQMRLKELKNWLKDCNDPDSIINQSFYHAKLQGPAPFKDNPKNVPFVTTYYENIDNEKVIRKIRSKLLNIQSRLVSELFKNKNVVISQKQPKNLLQLLTRAGFNTEINAFQQ